MSKHPSANQQDTGVAAWDITYSITIIAHVMHYPTQSAAGHVYLIPTTTAQVTHVC